MRSLPLCLTLVSLAASAWPVAAQEETDIPAMHQEAERRVARGQHERALGIYQQIVARDPNDPIAWYNLGELSRALSRPADCVTYLRRLVYLVPAEAVDVQDTLATCANDLAGGLLTVVAEPGQATIAVDGLVLARGRLEPMPLQPGPHEVRVEAPDWEPATTTVDIAQGAPETVSVQLEPRVYWGTLEIVCDQQGAAITLEGEPVGTSPMTASLRIQARRPYLVRLTKDGFHDWSRRIEIEPNEALVLEVRMQEVDPWEERFRQRQ